jgi:hypothetical protein
LHPLDETIRHLICQAIYNRWINVYRSFHSITNHQLISFIEKKVMVLIFPTIICLTIWYCLQFYPQTLLYIFYLIVCQSACDSFIGSSHFFKPVDGHISKYCWLQNATAIKCNLGVTRTEKLQLIGNTVIITPTNTKGNKKNM